MENKMENTKKFSDYTFAKISPTESCGIKDETTSAKMRNFFNKNLLLFVTMSGVILGIIIGFGLRHANMGPNGILLVSYPGELFMRILKLMILPLIVSSLISGSASLNAKMNGKIAVRTITYFILTSMFNAFLGICLVTMIHPGEPDLRNSITNSDITGRNVNILDSLLDLGRNIFPDNLFQAAFQQTHTSYVVSDEILMKNISGNSTEDATELETIKLTRVLEYRSGTNTLGIVFFCLVFGTVLGTIGPKGQIVIDFFTATFEVIMRIVTGVMWITPIGISSIIAGKILGVKDIALVMSQLGWFITTIIIGVFFYQLIVMQMIYFVFIRKNPYKFYWGLIQATLTASATASTAAALPVTFRCMNEKLKVDPRITRFVLPIGCNINMDGTALFVAVSSIFIAQMNNIELGFGELCTVLLTSTVASLSSASVPSAALVLLLIVVTAIDAPTEDISLLFAIDWFVDRIRTTNNMLGDCYAAAVVEELSKSELTSCDSMHYQGPSLLKPCSSDIECGMSEGKYSPSPETAIIDINVYTSTESNAINGKV